MELFPYGPSALMIRFARTPGEEAFLRGRALLAALNRNSLKGLEESVCAFTTVLLVFSGQAYRDRALGKITLITDAPLLATESVGDRTIQIPVCYGGADLQRVATKAGMSVDDVIRVHSRPLYRVHCLGFSPGFPYLGGMDPQLYTPRLDTPRTWVTAGSVAIGGEQTGIYSVASPGGWNLIGSTTMPLFRPDQASVDSMFCLRAGDRVQFLVDFSADSLGVDSSSNGPLTATEEASWNSAGIPTLRVHSVGAGLSIQDGGRPGFRRFGVPPGGAMDPYAASWANRLLDNHPDAPVLELCLQGHRLESMEAGWVSWTGAVGVEFGSRKPWSAFRVRAGEMLAVPWGNSGVWSYLAVPGGFAGPRFLGSTSSNPRAGIGVVTKPGMVLLRNPGSALTRFAPPSATATRRTPWSEVPVHASGQTFPVWPGPQWDHFSDLARNQFFSSEWRVSPQCDRVGYRFQGPMIHADPQEITSEALLPGSIQVPANGQPIVTMPDGPTLGGYPKIGILVESALGRLAQCRPGETVRFSLVA